MLINDFFKVLTITVSESSISSTIELNNSHKIFEGHFPNNPITPGVIQIQIVKELLEKGLKKDCTLKEVGRCKFLAILNPNDTPEVHIHIKYNLEDDGVIKVSTSGTSTDESQTFFKFTAKYS